MSHDVERFQPNNPSARALPPADSNTTKLDVAKDVVAGIIDQLAPADKLAITLFSDAACVPLPLAKLACLDARQVKEGVARDVTATASTNVAAGYDAAAGQLASCGECLRAGLANAENRVFLITGKAFSARLHSSCMIFAFKIAS
jgi:hypothetical protein